MSRVRPLRISDLGKYALYKVSLIALWLRLKIQLSCGWTHNYHPNPISLKGEDPRDSVARLRIIQDNLIHLESPSVLDIGCHQGFFLLALAENAGLSIGVDNDRGELMVGSARAQLWRKNSVVFVEMTLTPDNVIQLPSVDVIILMSVFHHWVRSYGEQAAVSMLEIVAQKVNKCFIFDTGQPNEIGSSWASQLDFMGPDFESWVVTKLHNFGFSLINTAGPFKTTISDVKRPLFIAHKSFLGNER